MCALNCHLPRAAFGPLGVDARTLRILLGIHRGIHRGRWLGVRAGARPTRSVSGPLLEAFRIARRRHGVSTAILSEAIEAGGQGTDARLQAAEHVMGLLKTGIVGRTEPLDEVVNHLAPLGVLDIAVVAVIRGLILRRALQGRASSRFDCFIECRCHALTQTMLGLAQPLETLLDDFETLSPGRNPVKVFQDAIKLRLKRSQDGVVAVCREPLVDFLLEFLEAIRNECQRLLEIAPARNLVNAARHRLELLKHGGERLGGH